MSQRSRNLPGDAAVIRQERLLPFLLDPRSYPHRPRSVTLIQTHGAFVFVAPPFVYKVKKAVNFGFLNFSTLQRRRHCCEREVVLNRRLTSDLYLGVLPITEKGGRFAWDGDGRVVEVAIQMRRLAPAYFLDRRLDRGAVTPADLERVAARMAAFYRTQAPGARVSRAGGADQVRRLTDGNFQHMRQFAGRTLPDASLQALEAYTARAFQRLARAFEARVREGHVVDGHGDLHLEHIHLTPRTLNIYDCIEFNDRFRQLDVAADIAFLAMDLDFRGRPDLARLVSERVSQALNDPGLLRMLDFYKCYRACVRGKVESLRSVAHAAPHGERTDAAVRARDYFRLALRYAVSGSSPMVLVVLGPPATGKSTVAAALARELGWDRLVSDRLRKELAGVPLHHRGSSAERRQLYSRARTEATYEALIVAAVTEAARGQSVILDATFSARRHRETLRKRCAGAGADCCFIELWAPATILRARLEARARAPGEVSDARLEDLSTVLRRYHPPSELPSRDRIRIGTSRPSDAVLARILTALARRQAGRGSSRR
ncbi:MAG: AAA family ATPase [Verrucomicrobiae bacterium]|nr:AAA family ATPase [Verrucomicrobiae bacterium]